MKISNAYFIGSLRTGGAESAVKNVILGLSSDAKSRVCLILLNDPEASKYSIELGVPVLNLSANGVLDAAWKLRMQLKDLGINRVHAHLAQCIMAAGLAVLGSTVELIAYIHTFGRWKSTRQMKGFLRVLVERAVCNKAAKSVVYVSETIRDLHLKNLNYSKCNSLVIPNPLVGKWEAARYDNSNTLRIITVGRLEKVKGIDWVLAAPWVDSFFFENEWSIVGNGSMFDTIKIDIAKHSNIDVKLLGARSDIPELLCDHHVFLLPSRSEGLSVAILEALRAGLPIVCTDVGANREMVLDGVNGFVIQVDDESALHSALDQLRDPVVRQRMGLESRRIFLDKFNPSDVIKKLEELLL